MFHLKHLFYKPTPKKPKQKYRFMTGGEAAGFGDAGGTRAQARARARRHAGPRFPAVFSSSRLPGGFIYHLLSSYLFFFSKVIYSVLNWFLKHRN